MLGAILLSTAVAGAQGPAADPYAPYRALTNQGLLADADQAVVDWTVAARLNADGSILLHEHLVTKVLTPAAVQATGELKVIYSGDTHVDSVRARTINPGGSQVPAAEAFKDLTLPVTDQAPMYSDLRARSITMPNVTVGSVLDLDVEETLRREDLPGDFWYGFGPMAFPVLHRKISINLPPGKSLYVDDELHGRHLLTVEPDGRRLETFEWSNIPAVKAEIAMPAPGPLFEASTIASWDRVAAWYAQLVAPQAEPDAAIRAKVKELTAGLKDDDARLRAIYGYVAREYRYVSLSFGIGAYRPHAAPAIFTSHYGDCKDKSTLLLAMVRALGWDGHLVLVNSSSHVLAAAPNPQQFDHAILAVLRPGIPGRQLLDPTSGLAEFGSLALGDDDRDILEAVPTGGRLAHTPPAPIEERRATEAVLLKVDATGRGTSVTDAGGGAVSSAMRRALLRDARGASRTEIEKELGRAEAADVRLTKFTNSDPADLNVPFTIHAERTLEKAIDFSRHPPQLPLWWHLAAADISSAHPREAPLDLTALVAPQRQTITVVLPAGLEPSLPAATHLKTDFATFSLEYSFDAAQHRLVARADLGYLQTKLPALRSADYVAFDRAVDAALVEELDLHPAAGASPEALAETVHSVTRLMEGEDYDAAVALARSVLSAQAGHPTIRDTLGECLLAQHNWTEARATLLEQLQRFPNDFRVHGLLGRVYLAQDQLPEALHEADAQLQVTPYNAPTQGLRGEILARSHRDPEALQAFAQAVAIEPTNPEWRVGWGELKLRSAPTSPAEAAAGFAAAATAEQVTPAELERMARALQAAGCCLDEAQAYAERATATISATLQGRSISSFTAKEKRAVQALPPALDLLAEVLQQRHSVAKAILLEQAAVAMAPADPQRLLRLAAWLQETEDARTAVGYLAFAARLPHAGANVLAALVHAYATLPNAAAMPVNVYLVQHAGELLPHLGTVPLSAQAAPQSSVTLLVQNGAVSDLDAPGELGSALRDSLTGLRFPGLEVAGQPITYEVCVNVVVPQSPMVVPCAAP